MIKQWATVVGIGVIGFGSGCAGPDGPDLGAEERRDEIKNGIPILAPRTDSQVLITDNLFNGSQSMGSGTLLSQEWVLTAGHVVDAFKSRTANMAVRLGNQSDPAAQVRSVAAIYLHPGHHVGGIALPVVGDVDVAMIRVSPPFTGAFTRGISVLTNNNLLNTSPICNGYGQTVEGNALSTGTLTFGSVRVTAVGTTWAQVVPGLANQILLGGDSGGPCFDAFGGVIGVISAKLGNPVTAGYFVPADAFRTWALGTIANCPGRTAGSSSFCSAECPCTYGNGDCEDGQCSTDNICDDDVGPAFGMSPTTDVCVPAACSNSAIGSDTYCTPGCPCGYGGGDCDVIGDCQRGLACAVDYGPMFKMTPTTDVCVPSACAMRAIGSSTFCSADCPCGHGGGDCDGSDQCMPGFVCADDIGPAFNMTSATDVCVPAACAANTLYSSTFCSPGCPCGEGGGDCDGDGDCMPGLVCVDDIGEQFGASATTDICQRP